MFSSVYPEKYSYLDSPIHRLDPRAKLISLFSLIIFCVNTPANAFGVFLAYFLFLLFLARLSRVPLRYLLGRSLVALPFVVMILFFAVFHSISGGGNNFLFLSGVLFRSYIAVLALVLLSSTTPFSSLLYGLKQLKLPSIFIQTGELMYRYLSVLSHEIVRMKRARDAR